MPELKIPGLKLCPYEYDLNVSKFDLTLWGWEEASELRFAFQYCTTLFNGKTIGIFIRYFQEIIASINLNPSQRLKEIMGIPVERKQQLLKRINRSIEAEVHRMRKDGQIMQHRLAETLGARKDHAAIEYGDSLLTYNELDKRSNLLAHRIRERAPRQGIFIGVLINHRMDFILTIIGIMKAGCVFIPIDSSYPPDRWQVMISSTDMEFIITDPVTSRQFVDSGISDRHPIQSVCLDDLLKNSNHHPNHYYPDQSPDITYSPEDQLYIYFTSGSTGIPKAVIGKNQSLLHFIDWEIKTFGIDETFRISQLANPGFDAFLKDTLVPLCAGGVVCIPPGKEILTDPGKLTHWIHRSRLNLVHSVPGIFRRLASGPLSNRHFTHLKFLLLAGEPVNPSDFIQWYETFGDRIQLVNLYGLTETTILKTHYMIKQEDLNRAAIPIGKPHRRLRGIDPGSKTWTYATTS